MITITVTPEDDPSTITGDTDAAAIEGDITDGNLTVTGTITITDPDDSPSFDDIASIAADFGTFSLTAGTWTYTVDQTVIQYLQAYETLTDSTTFTATDGNTVQVSVTITGTADDSTIEGDTTRTVTEGNLTYASWSAEFDVADKHAEAMREVVGGQICAGGLRGMKAYFEGVENG